MFRAFSPLLPGTLEALQTVTPRSVAYAYNKQLHPGQSPIDAYSIYVEENESNIGKKDHAEAFYIERMESELKG